MLEIVLGETGRMLVGDLYGKSLFAMPFGAVCIWMRARGTKWTQTDQVPVHNKTIKLPGIQKD